MSANGAIIHYKPNEEGSTQPTHPPTLSILYSFATISAVGANGAIIHYKPNEEGSAPLIQPEEEGKGKEEQDILLLLDSGAQYLDGTTDVTRTVGGWVGGWVGGGSLSIHFFFRLSYSNHPPTHLSTYPCIGALRHAHGRGEGSVYPRLARYVPPTHSPHVYNKQHLNQTIFSYPPLPQATSPLPSRVSPKAL